ncbi:LTA synthase family protein [Clostridium fallax]|uniref:Uncharacterized sulfatase n=1 Tax=Clostridium fallax TaxID=1533 RepID=A0A1M4WEB7_9CLOT|nr:LTA synthase family protein [Clostridium fallax]SHE79631.1 uncharacterized sulfatase [Clostridium fallax]SQB04930.1 sulfatase [Clostridium fallax]
MDIKGSLSKMSNFITQKLDKNALLRTGFLLLTLISLTLKSIYFLGFSLSKSAYNFNFYLGYENAKPYLLFYIAFIGLFLSFYFLFKGKGRYIYLLIINIVITFLIIVDIWYFRGFYTMPSILIVTQTANLDNMSGAIFSMISSFDFLFIIDFIILIIYLVIFRKAFKKVKTNFIGFIVTFLLCLVYVGYIPFNLYVLKNENVQNGWLFGNYDPTDTAKFFSPVGYHIIDAISVYKDSKPLNLTEQDKKEIDKYYELKNENLPDNEYKGIFKGKNLIVLQVESLESFVIGQSVQGQEITPNINRILKNSLYFPNIFEQVNEGTSSDSDLMVHTSMFPITKGSTFFRYPNTTYNSSPKILAKEGYTSAAMHPDKGSFWNVANALKGGIGFEQFYDSHDCVQDEIIGLGLSDRSFLKQSAERMKTLKQPFYSFVVTLTSHGPFDLPEEYNELKLTGELNDNVLGGYFKSINYTDKQIGMFLDMLDKEGLLDNTVVAIEGDHTGVHKYYNDKVETLKNPESWWLDDGNHVVPLIIYSKDLNEGKKFDVIGGQIDIMPTLLYSLGINNDEYFNTALGRPLLNTNRSFAIVKGKFKGTPPVPEADQKSFLEINELSEKMIKSNYFKNVRGMN